MFWNLSVTKNSSIIHTLVLEEICLNKGIGIIGGDLRNVKLANLFASDNYKVGSYAIEEGEFNKKVKQYNGIDEFIDNTDIIISSIPLSRDGTAIYTPLSKKTIYVDELIEKMKDKIFIAGEVKDYIYDLATSNNIEIIDLLKKEELAILNAIPTAEGAIQIAMQESEITLHGSNILILGYGRIGKVLSKMLQGIGANVYCEARKEEDLAMIESYGYNKVKLEELDNNLDKYDFIFNTIPYLILNKERLDKIKKECIIIDLASRPGGVDFKEAEGKGIKALLSLALPGKVAPATAAKYIQQVIYKMIK